MSDLGARDTCWCRVGDPCPLRKSGRGPQCTAAELRQALLDQQAAHDRRVAGLLNANNIEVERRRAAEALVISLRAAVGALSLLPPRGA